MSAVRALILVLSWVISHDYRPVSVARAAAAGKPAGLVRAGLEHMLTHVPTHTCAQALFCQAQKTRGPQPGTGSCMCPCRLL